MTGAEDVGKTVTSPEPGFSAWKVAEDWRLRGELRSPRAPRTVTNCLLPSMVVVSLVPEQRPLQTGAQHSDQLREAQGAAVEPRVSHGLWTRP